MDSAGWPAPAETLPPRALSAIVPAMRPSPKHRLRAMILALLLALGMGPAPVQGGLMAAEIAVAAEGAQPCRHHCDGCGENDVDRGTCLSVCGATAQGLPPAEPEPLPPALRSSVQEGRLILGGRSHSPDPGPPKGLPLADT